MTGVQTTAEQDAADSRDRERNRVAWNLPHQPERSADLPRLLPDAVDERADSARDSSKGVADRG